MRIAHKCILWRIVASFVTGLLSVACRPDIPPHRYQDSEFLRREFQAKRVVIIDARQPDEFKEGHIPGAVNIPHKEIHKHIHLVPKDKDIVLYCKIGGRSQKALEALKKQGYSRLFNFGGLSQYEGELETSN